MRKIKTATTDYLFQSSVLNLFVVLFCSFFALFVWVSLCARDPLVAERIAVAPRHSRLETEPSIAAISLTN